MDKEKDCNQEDLNKQNENDMDAQHKKVEHERKALDIQEREEGALGT